MKNILNISFEEISDYLGIDFEDDRTKRRLDRTLKIADTFLKGAIGEDYDVNDARAQEIALAVIDDLYSERGYSNKVSASTRKLIDNFILQLQLEHKRKKGETNV